MLGDFLFRTRPNNGIVPQIAEKLRLAERKRNEEIEKRVAKQKEQEAKASKVSPTHCDSLFLRLAFCRSASKLNHVLPLLQIRTRARHLNALDDAHVVDVEWGGEGENAAEGQKDEESRNEVGLKLVLLLFRPYH